LNNPLVSIITPTYKHEDFIGECIESVLGQTYDNWEQIIVDVGKNVCIVGAKIGKQSII
jgi:glycosyltransferase involved in cell wall biosynthesis